LPAAASTKANPTATDAGFDELSLDPCRGSCFNSSSCHSASGIEGGRYQWMEDREPKHSRLFAGVFGSIRYYMK
jgi:hypothetical protein